MTHDHHSQSHQGQSGHHAHHGHAGQSHNKPGPARQAKFDVPKPTSSRAPQLTDLPPMQRINTDRFANDGKIHTKSMDPNKPFGDDSDIQAGDGGKGCCWMLTLLGIMVAVGAGIFLTCSSATPEESVVPYRPPRTEPTQFQAKDPNEAALEELRKSTKKGKTNAKFTKDTLGSDSDSDAFGQNPAAAAAADDKPKVNVKGFFDSRDRSKIGQTVIDYDSQGEAKYFTIKKKTFGKKVKKVRNKAIDPKFRKGMFGYKKIKAGQEGQAQGMDSDCDSDSDRRRLMSRLTRCELELSY
jgi:hypothetical protein